MQILASQQRDQIFIKKEGLEDALPVALEMAKNGVEIFISRRGTSHLLRENLHIPVLAFPHRSIEILISLRQAAVIGSKILFPVFRHELSGLGVLEEILHIELVQRIYENKASLAQVIEAGRDDGCKVVVGGTVTQEIAEALGLNFVEIRTSDEDLAATIDDAKSVALSAREHMATSLRYRAIIDAATDGIIAVDENGRVDTINSAAVEFLSRDADSVLGKHLSQVIPRSPITRVLTKQETISDHLDWIQKDRYVFAYRPVVQEGNVIGAVTSFRDIGNVMRTENKVRRSLARGLLAKYQLKNLVHVSQAMRDVVSMAQQYAGTESTILLMGETGTGKEIFAHGIHSLSRRSAQPFVSVNCGALPEQLLESELFGYEEGSFTGSKKGGKPGRFEIAHQGTIFLDEIDSTSESVQIRLLQVLQEKEVMRIGGDRKIPVDVRIIAAAGRELSALVHEGKFRADLFFRLNVLQLQIPPLRKRKEDIPILLDHFIRLFSEQYNLEPITLPDIYVDRLLAYRWPGNVRQLRNFAERLVMNCSLRCSNDTLDMLYQELIQYDTQPVSGETAAPLSAALKERLKAKAEDNERAIIMEALDECRFHKNKAAERLGISRTTLWRKIKELGIE